MKGYSKTGRIRARQLRRSYTDAELRLWRRLRNRALGNLKFRRQHPIGPYVADLVCLERHLVIEIDGSQHAQQEFDDAKRTAYFERMGFSVLRFWDNDVLMRTDSVMERVNETLAPHPSPLPEKLGERG